MKKVNIITVEEFLSMIGNKSDVEDIKLMLYLSRWSVADSGEMFLVSPITFMLWFYRSAFECTEEPSEELYTKFEDVYVMINELSFTNKQGVENV